MRSNKKDLLKGCAKFLYFGTCVFGMNSVVVSAVPGLCVNQMYLPNKPALIDQHETLGRVGRVAKSH